MQAWIYIDIFDTQLFYRLTGQSETFTNQIFKRLFKILTEEEFRIHQQKCIQNWDSKKDELIDSDEENEDNSDEEEKEDEEEEDEEENEEDEEENEEDEEENEEDDDNEENKNESDCSNSDCK